MTNSKATLGSTSSIPFTRENKENIPASKVVLMKSSKKTFMPTQKKPSLKACIIKVKDQVILSLIRPGTKNNTPVVSPSNTSRLFTTHRLNFSRRHQSFSQAKTSPSPAISNLAQGDILLGMLEDEKRNIQAGCLANHYIKPTYRAKMVDWMIEVMAKYKYSYRCYFLACAIMDNYLRATPKILSNDDIHLLGITSMYIASKLEETHPMFLKEVYNSVGHECVSIGTMKRSELDFMKVLEYKTMFTTAIQFLYFYIDIAEESAKLKGKSVVLLIMAMHEVNMLRYRPSVLAAGAIKAALVKEKKGNARIVRMLEVLLYDWAKEVDKCMVELLQLEVEFASKYPDMTNVFTCKLLD